ncbi:hypothetical protein [Parafrankia sp. EUN1f]|uniref:hypothetical protein n=1 Tax=Parafrankia sp. EUN1f TaxID=102897 RepID=UPI00351082B1
MMLRHLRSGGGADLLGRALVAVRLPLCVGAGYALSRVLGSAGMVDTAAYGYLTTALLGLGLYGATSTIPRAARSDARLIVSVVTVGVVLKVLLIGCVLALVFRDPVYFLLAGIIAQIDPLSVAALLKNSPMSRRARSLLIAWSSFDDPVTVLATLVLLTVLPSMAISGTNHAGLMADAGFGTLAADLVVNGALVVGAWTFARIVRHRRSGHDRMIIGAVGVVYAVAVWRFLMFGLAAAGLFLRPRSPAWGRWVDRAVQAALLAAAVLLGILLGGADIDLAAGISLGVAAFAAQILVGLLLTRGLQPTDRVYLSLSQQNGITSIVLALTFQPIVPSAVGVVGVAIAAINILHLACNQAIARFPRLMLAFAGRIGGEEAPEPVTRSAG